MDQLGKDNALLRMNIGHLLSRMDIFLEHAASAPRADGAVERIPAALQSPFKPLADKADRHNLDRVAKEAKERGALLIHEKPLPMPKFSIDFSRRVIKQGQLEDFPVASLPDAIDVFILNTQ